MQLRPYQKKAIDLLFAYFKHNQGNPVIEAPTGSGKSVIQAAFIHEVLRDLGDNRFLCLTHQKELIAQNYLQLCSIDPTLKAGIYSASLNRRDTKEDVIFASIQSVYKKACDLGHFDLIIIDECHLCPVKTSEGMYRQFLDEMQLINPKIKIIGLSATPYRLDNGLLIEGDNRLFTDIIPAKAAGMTITDLLASGHLAPLTTEPVKTRLNTDGVGKRGGEYIAKDLAAAVDIDSVTAKACDEILRFGEWRDSWLVFATSVKHAEHIRDYLSFSVNCEIITGDTSQVKRDQLLDHFKKKHITCLVNVNVLTTGFDAPGVDMVVFMRPTMSASLYIQMAGRGMRTAPGKKDCLILDFAGLIDLHGPVDDVSPPRHREKKDDQLGPIKECPECLMLLPASTRTCPYCKYEFKFDDRPNINDVASSAAILSQNQPEKIKPTDWHFTIHEKDGKPPSIRVTYYDGLMAVCSEWICLFHGGYAQQKAEKWWSEHVNDFIYKDIFEAINLAEKKAIMPEYIYVKKEGKYKSIVSRGFQEAA